MLKRIPLAYWFLLPAAIAITLFFFLPVIMSFVFSFTTMASDTGIFGNHYVFSQSSIQALEDSDLNRDVYKNIIEEKYIFDTESLNALSQSKLRKKTVTEIEKKLSGKVYLSEKDLFKALGKLANKPRSFRDRKAIAKITKRSLSGLDFSETSEMQAAFDKLKIEVDRQDFDLIAELTNTSWHWTTKNYGEVFSSPDSLRILTNTGLYVVLTLGLFNVGFALLIALLTFYMVSAQSKFFRSLWLIPRITPSVLYVLLWRDLMDHSGIISYVVQWFGIAPTNWMGEFPWAAIIVINGFVGASMGMIIFSSAMQAIPKSLLYSSAVDGAYMWQQITRIILPQMRWPILFIASYQTLSLLTSFEYIQLSTDGGPARATEVWALHAFHTALSNYFGNLRYGYGATLAVALVIIGITASLLYLKFFKFQEMLQEPPIES